ncbi:MAG: GIY-YIG nuclease family protein [Hyphomonadaceae bacterium]|nr:GIY-YIG nuclease family protein [Hyphomonadaceae bacterium]
MARYDFIAVYIMASKRNGTLYTGVTSDLPPRVQLHRDGQVPGFTQKYGCKTLVWFEQHDTMPAAIKREKQIKRWLRKWKLELIEAANPTWRDLSADLFS